MKYLTPEHRSELYELFKTPYETEKEAREVLASFLEKHPEYTLVHMYGGNKFYDVKASMFICDNALFELNISYADGYYRAPLKITYEHDTQYQNLVHMYGGHTEAEKAIAQELRDIADGLENHTGPYKKSSFVVYHYESGYDGFIKSINLKMGGFVGG